MNSQSRDPLRLLTVLAASALLSCFGCAAQRAKMQPAVSVQRPVGLTDPQRVAEVEAICQPPIAWHTDPLKKSGRHTHLVWVSPSGTTAYGVIRFSLPWPVGADLTLRGFLKEMKKSEGRADLLSRQRDADLPGVRFVAEGGLYTIRAFLVTHGWRAWAVYAGTRTGEPVNEQELELAQSAREHTRVGER